MKKKLEQCFITQEKIQKSNDYNIKKCSNCGEDFYVSKYARANLCCKCRVEYNEKRELDRQRRNRKIEALDGFPKTEPFETIEELTEYLKGDGKDKIQCLECGRWYKTLFTHLNHKHNISVQEYKLKYGIPFHSCKQTGMTGLSGKELKDSQSIKSKKLIEKRGKENMLSLLDKEKSKVHMKNPFSPNVKKQTAILREEYKKFAKKVKGKKSNFPCKLCGKEVEVKLFYTMTNSCNIICKECKKNSILL